jgi:rSAM/selenodomain-associated transferase 1
MSHAIVEPVTIAILAKAPVAGAVKSRLIPALGADGAASLAARLLDHAVDVACAAGIGPVVLWAAPDPTHRHFESLQQRHAIALARQPHGDLGVRMHTAVVAAGAPVLVIGTDCPALTAEHLCAAAQALREHDAVVIPAEDGGYVLIGLRKPAPMLFTGMTWGTSSVMAETRQRLQALGLTWHEFEALWDVDRPEDIVRLRRAGVLQVP